MDRSEIMGFGVGFAGAGRIPETYFTICLRNTSFWLLEAPRHPSAGLEWYYFPLFPQQFQLAAYYASFFYDKRAGLVPL